MGSLHIILSDIKSRTAFSLKWLLKCLQNIPEKKSFNLNKISFRREQDRQNLWTCIGHISWRGILVIEINVLSRASESCEKTTTRVALMTIFTWICVYGVFCEVNIGIMCYLEEKVCAIKTIAQKAIFIITFMLSNRLTF